MKKAVWLEAKPLSLRNEYSNGNNAPPAMPMINKAAPVFVNFPRPLIAKGKIDGHINALAKPSNAINVMAVYPFDINTQMLNRIPRMAEIARAFC